MKLLSFPNDIENLIFQFLTIDDFKKLSLVSKKFKWFVREKYEHFYNFYNILLPIFKIRYKYDILESAIIYGNIDVFDYLYTKLMIKSGNQKNIDNIIEFSIKENCIDIFKYILNKIQKIFNIYNLLEKCIDYDNKECFIFLINKFNPNELIDKLDMLILKAYKKNRYIIFEYLLEIIYDINWYKYINTITNLLCIKKIDIFKLLIDLLIKFNIFEYIVLNFSNDLLISFEDNDRKYAIHYYLLNLFKLDIIPNKLKIDDLYTYVYTYGDKILCESFLSYYNKINIIIPKSKLKDGIEIMLKHNKYDEMIILLLLLTNK